MDAEGGPYEVVTRIILANVSLNLKSGSILNFLEIRRHFCPENILQARFPLMFRRKGVLANEMS
jgi:hypothetical protein